LARSHRKRQRWLGRRSWSAKIPHRVSIRERPDRPYTNIAVTRGKVALP
jgi:hypothetical protein